jgi:hypothetical protein
MNGLNISLKTFMIILVLAGIVVGVIGAVIANQALIVAGAILMSVSLILKIINDLILEEFIPAILEIAGLGAIAFLYIWSTSLSSSVAASVIDRPVLWVVVGVGIIELLLFLFVFHPE